MSRLTENQINMYEAGDDYMELYDQDPDFICNEKIGYEFNHEEIGGKYDILSFEYCSII